MSIDTCVTSSAGQTLVVLIRNVLSGLWVTVPLSETEIDDVNYVLFLSMADQEVVRLHVSMNEMVIVQEFESLNHLVRDHERSFNGEFSFAEIESILQTGSQQVHYHRIVVSFHSEPVDAWNTG